MDLVHPVSLCSEFRTTPGSSTFASEFGPRVPVRGPHPCPARSRPFEARPEGDAALVPVECHWNHQRSHLGLPEHHHGPRRPGATVDRLGLMFGVKSRADRCSGCTGKMLHRQLCHQAPFKSHLEGAG